LVQRRMVCQASPREHRDGRGGNAAVVNGPAGGAKPCEPTCLGRLGRSSATAAGGGARRRGKAGKVGPIGERTRASGAVTVGGCRRRGSSEGWTVAVGRPSQGGSTRRTLRSGARCNTRAEVWRRKPSRWWETTRTERGAAVAGRSRRRHDVVARSGLQAGDPRRKGDLWTWRSIVSGVSTGNGRADVPRRETAEARGERAVLRAAVQGQEGWERRSAKNGSPPARGPSRGRDRVRPRTRPKPAEGRDEEPDSASSRR
jgi:hypothetical protein